MPPRRCKIADRHVWGGRAKYHVAKRGRHLSNCAIVRLALTFDTEYGVPCLTLRYGLRHSSGTASKMESRRSGAEEKSRIHHSVSVASGPFEGGLPASTHTGRCGSRVHVRRLERHQRHLRAELFLVPRRPARRDLRTPLQFHRRPRPDRIFVWLCGFGLCTLAASPPLRLVSICPKRRPCDRCTAITTLFTLLTMSSLLMLLISSLLMLLCQCPIS